MTISLTDTADLFDQLSRLCRQPLGVDVTSEYAADDQKVKAAILLSAQGGVRTLQQALDVPVDGLIGPVTQSALDKISVGVLLNALSEPVSTTPHAAEYTANYQILKIDKDRIAEIRKTIVEITRNEERYKSVADKISVPYWTLIGFVHYRESSLDFDTHLHNGDTLEKRTTHVPKGRPVGGFPPFTWEESAIDALTGDQHWDTWKDWSTAGRAYLVERLNGFGYRNHGINSPYLYAGSNLYTKGKYVADGEYDPNFVDKQLGAMTLLKAYTDGV